MTDEADTGSYAGLFGAFGYALRTSRSRLFRSYVLVGGLVTLLVTALIGFALVRLIAATSGVPGGTLTLSRSFFVVVGLLVVGPLLAPVLVVARRHRRDVGHDPRYDAALAAAGYLFICSLYVGLVVSVPPDQQTTPTGALAPLAAFLYALPAPVALAFPTAAALLMWAAHRRLR